MKFFAIFERAQVDMASYSKELDRTLREALAHSIYAYLNAVFSKIPVWSGASRATFLQLARTISLDIPIDSVAWMGTGTKGHPSHSALLLNRIPLGERCGTGRLEMDIATGKYSFEYTNSLHYLTYNEYHNANVEHGDPAVYSTLKRPGPYNFQLAGAQAFEQDAKDIRLTSPWNHLKISRLTVGTRTVI